MKNIKLLLLIGLLALNQKVNAQALRVLTPNQGGTGIGTFSVSDVGKCIKFLTVSPYPIYELGTCGSGGGSGGGTFSTTTSNVLNQLINYPNNNTDIVTVGGNSTTTAKVFFDPNIGINYISGKLGIGTSSPYSSLSVVGQVVGSYFTATTSTSSTFPYASTTAISSNLLQFIGYSALPQVTAQDITTGLHFDGPGIISFHNGGIQTMLLSSINNVGIASSSPGQRLSVGGDILGDNIIGARFNATSSIASILPYASTTVFTSSGNSYFATSGGSVGIGTTSPIAKLSINPIAGDQASFIIGSSTATKFIVNASGYVGIGTSSPNSPLSISAGSSGYTPSGVLFAENNGSAAASYVAQFSSGSATGNSYPTFNLTNSGSTILNSQSSFLGYGTNVSIVGSGGAGRGQLVITNGASATNWFNIFVDSSANANLSANGPIRVFKTIGGTSDIFNVASSTGGLATSTYLTVNAYGNVGIGTSSPTTKLAVGSG